jgi:hypothetical protein
MDVLLQIFNKLPVRERSAKKEHVSDPGRAVPSPPDGDKTIRWWWDHLASQPNVGNSESCRREEVRATGDCAER